MAQVSGQRMEVDSYIPSVVDPTWWRLAEEDQTCIRREMHGREKKLLKELCYTAHTADRRLNCHEAYPSLFSAVRLVT